MKKKFNVIQINGFRGMLTVAGIVICLFAGFVIFPGVVMKTLWNVMSMYVGLLPKIATIQGVLLWGIMVVGYLAFRRRGFFIEFKSANDLTGEEMEAVMRRIRIDRQTDIISKAFMRAKEIDTAAKEADENSDSEHNEVSEKEGWQ
ncbi:MAG: hypothetical protein LUB59_00325 [Candidatus Gastranaerophilales bacterium]|nr:hypothetical protein [Candidatus Gastranaerophilales bacterium]